MNDSHDEQRELTQAEAVAQAMNTDLAERFKDAEVVRERRPAKMVTALRIDLDIQAELEAAAAARGVGTSTLMRQIIEEWVQANRQVPAPDEMGELLRHLDAARRAADTLVRRAAA